MNQVNNFTVLEILLILAILISIAYHLKTRSESHAARVAYAAKQSAKYDKILRKQEEMDHEIAQIRGSVHTIKQLLEIRIQSDANREHITEPIAIERKNGIKIGMETN